MKSCANLSLLWLLALASLANLGCVVGSPPLRMLEHRLMFHPQVLPENAPVAKGVESVWFTASDGVKLHGIYASPSSHEPRAYLLHCHGNGGNVDLLSSRMRQMADKFQVGVFCFDYRGYGRSPGKPNEVNILADARAARRWLAERGGIQEFDVILMGMSLGGGVAVDLAGNDGCCGLILENTFTSLPDVANHHSGMLQVGSLMQAKLPSVETIARYQGPLLQRHGDADLTIPFEQGIALFAAAPGPKQFIDHKRGGHNDLPNEEFESAMNNFITRLVDERAQCLSASQAFAN